jgi:hypothetical protein
MSGGEWELVLTQYFFFCVSSGLAISPSHHVSELDLVAADSTPTLQCHNVWLTENIHRSIFFDERDLRALAAEQGLLPYEHQTEPFRPPQGTERRYQGG